MSFETLAIIVVAIAVGSFAKGLTGLGLPIITIPILSGILGAEHAIVVMTIPTFASNLWIVWSYRKRAHHVPKLGIALAFAAVGTVIGTYILASLDDRALMRLLIVWIALYLLVLLLKPDFRLQGKAAERGSPVLAAFAGVCQGATGIAGPVVATWIHAYRLEKETYVFAVSIMFLVISGVHVSAVSAGGLIDSQRLVEGLMAVIPTLLFVPLGMRMTRYLSPLLFNRLIILCIVAMEARMIWKEFFAA
jgi:uncharacterized membrane protein YfcA